MENLEFSFEEVSLVFEQKELTAEKKLIHERAITRAQRYLIAEADLLKSIIEVDKNKLYEDFGLSYLTPYCVKHLGLTDDVAAIIVRVARKTYEVPELKTAIEEGKLSVTKAKTIAPVINADNQETWVEKAETLSKSQLEKEVAYVSPKAKKPEKAKLEGPDLVRYEFNLTEEESAFFRRAQDILCQKKGKSVSLSETQMELLKCFLDRHDPVRKAQRNTKQNDLSVQDASTRNQPQDCSVRDASVQDQSRDRPDDQIQSPSQNRSCKKQLDQSSLKKKVARVKRTPIPAAEIHKVNLRDHGQCQARLPDGSKCCETKWTHFHHIIPQSKGGSDRAENLVTLCSAHHRIWHARGW
jgi:hypothetical protein